MAKSIIFQEYDQISKNKNIKRKWQLQNFKMLKDAEDKLRELELKLNFKSESTLEWRQNKDFISRAYRTSLVQ